MNKAAATQEPWMVPEQPASVVESALGRVEQAAYTLQDQIEDLLRRIEPALVPSIPAPPSVDCGVNASTPTSSLTAALYIRADMLDTISRRVAEAIKRVEL